MKTLTINLYEIGELSPEAEKKAVEAHRNINIEGMDWWQYIYDEYEQTGFEVESFDLDRKELDGGFTESGLIFAQNAVKSDGDYYHGEDSHLVQACQHYISQVIYTDRIESDFENEIKDIIRDELQTELDYIQEDESVANTIEMNEFMFFEDGTQAPSQLTK